MKPEELHLFHLTTALRTQMMDTLTDEDLAFSFPNNPTLGELCREMGSVEQGYIESFKTLKHPWGSHNTEPEMAQSVERLKAWYRTLDEEFVSVLSAIPDEDLQTKSVDRGGGFKMPLGGQYHTYREALLIFCGNCKPYLMTLNKPLTQQWRDWIG